MNFQIDAKIETRTFKSGTSAEVLVLKLSKHSEKLVFLQSAEMELLRKEYNLDDDYDDMPDLR